MSANGKRVLPTTAASTAALVPFSHPGYAAGQTGRSGDSEDLIDQLVGGLVQADRSTKSEANFFNQREDSGSYGRTYSIDDEEIDEPPVPIPSTWQAQSATKEPSWLAEQLKASVYGFIIGLFVVIPAVMLLTGQTERLPSWSAVSQYASTTATQFGIKLDLGGAKPVSEASSAVAANSETNPTAPTQQEASATQADRSSVETVAPVATAAKTLAPSATPATATAETKVPVQEKPAIVTSNATETQKIASLSQPTLPQQPLSQQSSPDQSASVAQPAIAAPVNPESSPADQSAVDPAAPPPAAPAATQAEAAEPTAAAPLPTLTERETTALADSLAKSFVDNGRQAAASPTDNQAATGQTSKQAADPMPDALTIETARFLMKNGKMEDGREILAKLASRGNAGAIFALAESFDPNVLAAWGSSGVVAEPEKAKIFYSMALSQGFEAALPRLKGLE